MAFTWNPNSIHYVPIVDEATGIETDYIFGEASCLSADTKPVEKVYNGSIVVEGDTSKVYAFDMENSVWNEI